MQNRRRLPRSSPRRQRRRRRRRPCGRRRRGKPRGSRGRVRIPKKRFEARPAVGMKHRENNVFSEKKECITISSLGGGSWVSFHVSFSERPSKPFAREGLSCRTWSVYSVMETCRGLRRCSASKNVLEDSTISTRTVLSGCGRTILYTPYPVDRPDGGDGLETGLEASVSGRFPWGFFRSSIGPTGTMRSIWPSKTGRLERPGPST